MFKEGQLIVAVRAKNNTEGILERASHLSQPSRVSLNDSVNKVGAMNIIFTNIKMSEQKSGYTAPSG